LQKLEIAEKDLIKKLYQYSIVLENTCTEMNPAKWIDYIYELAKTYNKFYNDCAILSIENEQIKNLRILLTQKTGIAIKNAFALVGISVPDRM
jgi:arginyl-tRNA synthetase